MIPKPPFPLFLWDRNLLLQIFATRRQEIRSTTLKSPLGLNAEEKTLQGFINRFSSEIADNARLTLEAMRKMFPGATALVYDNYNALVVGFSSTEKPSDGFISLVVHPARINLFFFSGASLIDPQHLLEGTGKKGRHMRIQGKSDLERPEVRRLISEQVKRAKPWPKDRQSELVIKSISKNQRPRRVD